MLKDERYEQILEILEHEKYVSAVALAKRLFVSLPTIRRDLAELARRGQIVRNHGGAKKANDGCFQVPLDFRTAFKLNEKKRLCLAAATLIKENDIVFIDASTTVSHLANHLSHLKSVMVVTNGIPIAMLLIKNGIKTYCTGGELIENSLGYAGSYAEEFVRNFNFDITFFSSHGVNHAGDIIDTSLPETMLRRVVLKQSKQSVFLCDGDKFFQTAPYNLMPLDEADYIITNTPVPQELNFHQDRIIIAP